MDDKETTDYMIKSNKEVPAKKSELSKKSAKNNTLNEVKDKKKIKAKGKFI